MADGIRWLLGFSFSLESYHKYAEYTQCGDCGAWPPMEDYVAALEQEVKRLEKLVALTPDELQTYLDKRERDTRWSRMLHRSLINSMAEMWATSPRSLMHDFRGLVKKGDDNG